MNDKLLNELRDCKSDIDNGVPSPNEKADADYRTAYTRGWRYSQRETATLDHGDEHNEPDAWYDGYLDYAASREKWHTLLCRQGLVECDEHDWGQR